MTDATPPNSNPSLCIVGAPMDLGQSRRGVDMGPSALRYAGLQRRLAALGCQVQDCGNVGVAVRDTLPREGGMAFLPAVVEACEAIYAKGVEAIANGDLPLFLGGDHSTAMGTVGAASHERRTGVLWIDAHGDFNTPETSPSGNIHGMPLAALTGNGIPEMVNLGRPGPKISAQDVMLIGIRDLDTREREMLRASGAGVYTMREIDDRGIGPVAREAVKRLEHLPRVHVSLDLDALDPREAPGVGTPVTGGLTYREAHLLMEIIAESITVGSIDIVEVNPILDHSNRTAELAIELLLSLLGKTII
ncbi:MAG: arginase [Acidobacteriota bacterium]